MDVYCNAVIAPTTGTDAFEAVTQSFATLHVPASAIEDYKTTFPWKQFGKIVALSADETSVSQAKMASSKYYLSPSGVKTTIPSKGMNIVVTEYEDGSTSVSKEYVGDVSICVSGLTSAN